THTNPIPNQLTQPRPELKSNTEKEIESKLSFPSSYSFAAAGDLGREASDGLSPCLGGEHRDVFDCAVVFVHRRASPPT
uniref:Uncharacterized protein n=1 Tax=Aegilops tauschii subsp. strangulata TaxID=200361 RepID=A0A453NYB3_AEGTS